MNKLINLSLAIIGIMAASAAHASAEKPHSHKKKTDQKLPQEAVVVLRPTKGYTPHGAIRLIQKKNGIHLQGTIHDLEPGLHGFHIHEYGDLRARDGKSAGGHYSPEGHPHGGPEDQKHHAGDLGNITANKDGVAKVDIIAKDLKLHFLIGRSIVVHAGMDDLSSQPSGDAGPRASLGVIGFANVKQHEHSKK